MPKKRLEYSALSEQHRAPPARQPGEEEQQIPGHVDERMSAAERQPSPQRHKPYAALVAALEEALRSVKAERSISNDQSSNASSAGFAGSLKEPSQFHGHGPREWLAQLEQYHSLLDVRAIIPQVSFKVGKFCTPGQFLVATVPYPLILGLDSLRGLRTVSDVGSPFFAVAAVSAYSLPDQSQCLMLSAAPSHVQQPTPEAACGGPCISKSPQSLLGSRPCSPNQHKVEEWLATAPQQGVYPNVVQLAVKYKDISLDVFSDGLSSPRAFDTTIATFPNATVPKGGSPCFTQSELSAIRNVLEEYLRKKWIRSSRSPYACS
ncbi:hypothetical protein Esti_002405 [Eimeria stiedai]